MEAENQTNTSEKPLSRNQIYYRANKERLNAERCAKAKVEWQRKKAIKHILGNIKALFMGIEGENFDVVMEDPALKEKYNTLICDIREKHLEKLKPL